jgi:hypothetical protein
LRYKAGSGKQWIVYTRYLIEDHLCSGCIRDEVESKNKRDETRKNNQYPLASITPEQKQYYSQHDQNRYYDYHLIAWHGSRKSGIVFRLAQINGLGRPEMNILQAYCQQDQSSQNYARNK